MTAALPDQEVQRARAPVSKRNPCQLEIDLMCRGVRVDPACDLARDARLVSRTRAGLGSGLELVIPGPLKEIWANVPVAEPFARRSPYLLRPGDGGYVVVDERCPGGILEYPVRLPPQPAWYTRSTSRGTPMHRIGVLQGTYLGIYVSNSCGFWYFPERKNCRFCTTGLNVGVNEVATKPVDEVLEVARAAKEESGVTFVHLNTGWQAGRDLHQIAPYAAAVKREVGALVGVQAIPSRELALYDRMAEMGVDHFSFCYEFHNPEWFARLLPGKEERVGQETFFRALEYTSRLLGKGACSGEIIAGLEPVEDTLAAITYIASLGAFPTVCIFRPLVGADLEGHPPPEYEEMERVFRHLYAECARFGIPIGLAPNIEVSLIVQPTDARYLAEPGWRTWWYHAKLAMLRPLARWHFRRRMRPVPGLQVPEALRDPGPQA